MIQRIIPEEFQYRYAAKLVPQVGSQFFFYVVVPVLYFLHGGFYIFYLEKN
jgi:hypothetical protein